MDKSRFMNKLRTMSKARLTNIAIIIAFVIATFVFVDIYSQTNNSIETQSDTDYNDNWIKNEIVMTKRLSSKWNWCYTDGKRSFIQVCSTPWTHDSVYHVNDKLITYYENKKNTGSEQYSYLRNNKGKILYIVETGDPRNIMVNSNEINTKFVIKNNDGNIIAYVPDLLFVNDEFTIYNMDKYPMITATLSGLYKEKKWIFSKTNNNTLPLSLPIGMASKISFSSDGELNKGSNSDGCSDALYTSFIMMIICGITGGIFLIVLFVDMRFDKKSPTMIYQC